MIHLFCGFDRRETAGFFVFLSSVLDRATSPVVIRRMDAQGLPAGSNAFTFSRFLVPALMGFQGRAIFADASDMLCQGDLAELDALFDPNKAVQVVQHHYQTKHRIKYVGTEMECPNVDYPRKNWASLMLINCAHPGWAGMTPEFVKDVTAAPRGLLGLQFLDDEAIGALPSQWNVLADEGQPLEGARILHWTAGLPCFKHYADTPGADLWRAERDRMLEIAA